MSSVDWDHPEPHSRLKKGRLIHESRFWATCQHCGGRRLLKKYDAQIVEQRSSPCQRCANVQKGKLGFKATAKKFGRDFASQKAREKRLSQPSSLEAMAIDALEDLGLRYEREVECGPYYIDFVVSFKGREYALEVEGAYVHSLRNPHREAVRTAYIESAYGPIVILREAQKGQFLSIIAREFRETSYVEQQAVYTYA